ncbi:MAG: sigma-70 family RNA polymerase sigma factor [Dysgonomonas sp.]|nr:sigma-70 family RNA polymerase sigma factor [Dysgonomonas sp.]
MDKEDVIYSQIYRKYVDELFSYGIGLGFSESKCMDAIHDIFCKIYTNKKELDNVLNLKYYLFRSLKNRLIDIYKQENKVKFKEIEEYNFSIEVSVIDAIIDEEERHILKNKVELLMQSLSNNQREAIYLRYMLEMDYDEIGKLLNINAESVRKLVYRGIDKLRGQTSLDIAIVILLYFT